ncbi:MAG: nascent polypeptide-associated complex protein [Promethearchaeia archaeon]
MVKLPKEIKKKQKKKPRRRTPVKKSKSASKFGSRQMRRRMQNQGIDMDEINATRVLIEGNDKTLVINQPEVVLMKQAGQEIYQVIGDAEEYSPEEINVREGGGGLEGEEEIIEEDVKPEITENDIMLVASQTNVSKEEAEAALQGANGDIAQAIINLKNRP